MAQITQERITAEEYLRLPESNQFVELVDGKVIAWSSLNDTHQQMVGRIVVMLHSMIPSGVLRFIPSSIILDQYNVLEPDVFWVAGVGSRCKLGKDHFWHGTPDLIVEVISPSTASHDMDYKFKLYQKHGVREYWIVNAGIQYVDVFTLENNKFKRLGVFEAEHSFESPVLNNQKVELQTLFAA